MYQSRSIKDFFKPLARPRPEDDSPSTVGLMTHKGRSTSPGIGSEELPDTQMTQQIHSTALDSSLSSPASSDSLGCPTMKTLPPRQVTVIRSSSVSAASGIPSPGTDASIELTLDTFQRILKEPAAADNPILVSSQRVIRNGQIVIRNSDAESDSCDSLNLDDLLPIRQCSQRVPYFTKDGTPSTRPSTTEPRPKRKTRSSKKVGSRELATIPKYQFSLASLVAQARQEDAAEVKIAEARELVGTLEHRRTVLEAGRKKGAEGSQINQQLLASFVESKGDDDKMDKLMHAIHRTEALQQKKLWSFFKHENNANENAEFPSSAAVDSRGHMVVSPVHRKAAFVTGYMAETAATGKLPDEILSWTITAVSMEPLESLQQTYLPLLMSAGNQVGSLLTSHHIDSLFRRVGAHETSLDVEHAIEPILQTPGKADDCLLEMPRVRHVLNLLADVAKWMTSPVRIHSLCILCRLAVDSSIFTDGALMIAFEDAFEKLVAEISPESVENEFSVVSNIIFSHVTDMGLRLQLVKSLSDSTARTCHFRRQLAMSFFFEDTAYLDKLPHHLTRLSSIRRHLRQTQFSIHNKTDYSRLNAAISLLDIGLDDGDPPTLTEGPEAEAKFNRSVDKLADTVKNMFTKIVDSGASHMTRTEAKDTLEALHSRIEYAVRTKSKPKKDLFGNAVFFSGQGVQTGDFMTKFLGGKVESTINEQ